RNLPNPEADRLRHQTLPLPVLETLAHKAARHVRIAIEPRRLSGRWGRLRFRDQGSEQERERRQVRQEEVPHVPRQSVAAVEARLSPASWAPQTCMPPGSAKSE